MLSEMYRYETAVEIAIGKIFDRDAQDAYCDAVSAAVEVQEMIPCRRAARFTQSVFAAILLSCGWPT